MSETEEMNKLINEAFTGPNCSTINQVALHSLLETLISQVSEQKEVTLEDRQKQVKDFKVQQQQQNDLEKELMNLRKLMGHLEEVTAEPQTESVPLEEQEGWSTVEDMQENLKLLKGRVTKLEELQRASTVSSDNQLKQHQDMIQELMNRQKEIDHLRESLEDLIHPLLPLLDKQTPGIKLGLELQNVDQLQQDRDYLMQQDEKHKERKVLCSQTDDDVSLLQEELENLKIHCEGLSEDSREHQNRIQENHSLIQENQKLIQEIQNLIQEIQNHIQENQNHIQELFTITENLDQNKVDRTELESELEKLNEILEDIESRVMAQEENLEKAVDKLSSELELKVSRLELEALKKHLGKASHKMKDKSQNAAAGTIKQVVNCLSCASEVVQSPGPGHMFQPSHVSFATHSRHSGGTHTIIPISQRNKALQKTYKQTCEEVAVIGTDNCVYKGCVKEGPETNKDSQEAAKE